MKLNKQKTLILVSTITLGAILGLIYWKTIGCASETCPITSKWHWTTLYGSFAGYVLGDFIYTYINKKQRKS